MKNLIYALALLISFSSFGQTAEEYFKSAFQKDDLGDYIGAIADFSKSIELLPEQDRNKPAAYNNRGFAKLNKAIELDPNSAIYYNDDFLDDGSFEEWAISKETLRYYNGAISDFDKAIELKLDYTYAYKNRGYTKSFLKDYKGAIADYTKAIGLDPNYVEAYSNRGISKESLGDLNGACADWKKAAELGDTDAAKWVANQCN